MKAVYGCYKDKKRIIIWKGKEKLLSLPHVKTVKR
jgi:hypothetical protein